MFDLFDFNRNGKVDLEEETLGMMLVMGAFDEKLDDTDADAFDDDFDDQSDDASDF